MRGRSTSIRKVSRHVDELLPDLGVVHLVPQRSIGGAMDATARRIAAEREPGDLLSTLEANASSTFRPPGMPPAAPLTDAVAHGADIRWALGDPAADWSSPSRLLPVLDFLTSPPARAGFVPPGRLRGMTLVVEDQDWRHGEGAVVRGASLAVVMGVLGRGAAAPHLSERALPSSCGQLGVEKVRLAFVSPPGPMLGTVGWRLRCSRRTRAGTWARRTLPPRARDRRHEGLP